MNTNSLSLTIQRGKQLFFDFSEAPYIDRRIQAASTLAFSFVPIIYYRKEIAAQLLSLIPPNFYSFLNNTENLPPSLNTEEIIRISKQDPPEVDNPDFQIDKRYSTEEWLEILPTLSKKQLVKAAERVLPSAEPYFIKTNEEKFHRFLRDIATQIHRLMKGIEYGFSVSGVIKEIREYPQGFASVFLNSMIWFAYNKLSPLLSNFSFVEQASQLGSNRKFRSKPNAENPVVEQSIKSFISNFSFPQVALGTAGILTCYRLMQKELPHGVTDLCLSLENRKIPYRGLDFYSSWNKDSSYKAICENILTYFFANKMEQSKAIVLSNPSQNDHASIQTLIYTLAEMAHCGRSDQMREPFHVLSVDVQTLFNDSAGDSTVFEKKWKAILQYQKGNTVLYLTKFTSLYSQVAGIESADTEGKKRKSSRYANSTSTLPYCLGYILDSIKDGDAHCIIAANKEESHSLLESEDKECFHPMNMHRMIPEQAKKLLNNLCSTCDRWETPKLKEETIDQLMDVIENHDLQHELPHSLLAMADQSIRAATVEQEKKLLEHSTAKDTWREIKETVGKRLDEARFLKESLFEQLCRLNRENKDHSQIPQISIRLLIIEHVIIPHICASAEAARKKIEGIPYYIEDEQLFTLIQRQHKKLFHAAGPVEIEKWEQLPSQLKKEFSDREAPIETICEVLKTRRIAYDGSNKPVSILLFGPPGTGKSYLSKTIAAKSCEIFNIDEDPDPTKEKNVLRIYLSQVSWKQDTKSFFKNIIKFIKKNNTGFIILEEMDKIPAKALDNFLQLLDDMPLKSKHDQDPIHKGNVTFIFTSNACTEALNGPGNEDHPSEQFEDDKELFKREWCAADTENKEGKEALLTRFDAIVPYRSLSKKSTAEYVQIFLEKQKKIWKQHYIQLEFDPSVTDYFANGQNNRQLQQEIRKKVCNLITKQLSEFRNKKVLISVEDDQLVTP